MIETPSIARITARPAAVLRITVPRTEIRQAMGEGIAELMSTLKSQGIEPAGAMYSHHFRMDPATFDFEIGFPVETAVTPAGRVAPGELPAAIVARTVYHGAYEGLGAAWGEFSEWIRREGHDPAPNLWEVYAVGPETSPDPADWRTELNRPLVARGTTG